MCMRIATAVARLRLCVCTVSPELLQSKYAISTLSHVLASFINYKLPYIASI